MFFGFFLEAFVFYTSWHQEGWGDFPVLSWCHSTGHLHVQSPSPAATRAYCAEMLRKECLELSNTLVQNPQNQRLLRWYHQVWNSPRVCYQGFSKAGILNLSSSLIGVLGSPLFSLVQHLSEIPRMEAGHRSE